MDNAVEVEGTTEAAALAATPPRGFVHDYVHYALTRTDAPAGFHLATGIAVLSAATTQSLVMQAFGNTLKSHLWCLLIGLSGEARKSTALGIGRGILSAAIPEAELPVPGSEEGFVDSLTTGDNRILFYTDFGQFLSKAQQQGYFSAVKTRLTEAWDGTPLSRARANGKNVFIPNPRVSLLAATTLAYLEAHSVTEDWTGGFLSRFTWMVCRRERAFDWPEETTESLATRQALVDMLKVIRASPVPGPPTMTASAAKAWRDWQRENSAVNDRISDAERESPLGGALARSVPTALKLALLYCVDFGDGQHIETEHINFATRYANLHINNAHTLVDRIAPSVDMRDRRLVLASVRADAPTSIGEVCRSAKLLKRRVEILLDTLVAEQAVVPCADGRYRRGS